MYKRALDENPVLFLFEENLCKCVVILIVT